MSSFAPRLLLALLPLACFGCRGISVQSTYDESADFRQLVTFDWLQPPPDAATSVRDAALHELLGAELEARGLRRDTSRPDLLVAMHRTIEGVLNTQSWGYEFRGGKVDRYAMQEGTLVVDLIAAATRKSVWRGTAQGMFKFESTPEERRAMMQTVFRDLFADFPPGR